MLCITSSREVSISTGWQSSAVSPGCDKAWPLSFVSKCTVGDERKLFRTSRLLKFVEKDTVVKENKQYFLLIRLSWFCTSETLVSVGLIIGLCH